MSGAVTFGTQPANQLIMEEAYRPVTIREGDRVIQLPTIQALFRATNAAAIKGDRFARKAIFDLVQQLENSDRELQCEYFETMTDLKVRGEKAIEQALQRGLPEPELIPHPDEFIIDRKTANVSICGPLTTGDKARWDKALTFMDEAKEEVTKYAEQ